MAACNATQSFEQVDNVNLRFMVDRKRNKVLYAEAGKDFVDVLLSFLTMPLGTIARLVAEDSNIEAVKIGSISSLHQSVADLDEEHLWNQTCKEMLLKPKNPMERYCLPLKLNIDETEPLQYYFRCVDKTCKIENMYCMSFFKNQKCICGKLLNKEKSFKKNEVNGFVKETSAFIVSDDLYVKRNVTGTNLNILQKLGFNHFETIDKQTVPISKKEVVDILKLSLVSKTPLTDFIFKKEQFVGNLDPRNRSEFWIGEVLEPCDKSHGVTVKVVRRKSNEQILFVEAQDDFADFVFSFLTFPLGGVLRMLQGLSFLSCVDNLYKSMTELSSGGCLTSEELKDKLTKPPIAVQYELKNHILPLHNDYKDATKQYKYVDPKSPISGGYVKGPLTFIVTDDMVVTPLSSIDVVSYLEKMKVPLNDLEERVVRIGRKEGLSILKASLTTTSALTNGLSLYIMEQFMNEQRSQSIHKRAKFARTTTN